MKITVTHSTLYRYSFPVYLEPHIFRLQRRMSGTQRLLVFDIHIVPAVAAGFDPDLASPVAGWYSGGSGSRMEASVCLQVDDAG